MTSSCAPWRHGGRYRRWRALPGLIALLGITAALPGCESRLPPTSVPPPTPESIAARGVLRVATLNSPTTYYLGSHAPEGLEYELVNGFARQLGVRLKIEVFPNRSALRDALAGGQFDLVAAQLSWDPAWEDVGLPAAPYDSVPQHWIYRRSQRRPATLADIAARRVVVMEDSVEALYLSTSVPDADPPLRWIELSRASGIDALDAVGRGSADVTLVDGHEFAFARALHPEVGIAFSLPQKRPVQWILPRGAEALREAVDDWFAEERRSGRLAAVSARTLQAPGQMRRLTAREFRTHVEQRLPELQPLFEQASVQTGVDWRLLAALAYQESQWNTRAQSPNGAQGIMMLMPETAPTVGVQDPFDPRQNILGGARYLREVLAKIPARIKEPDRSWFAIASYNMGYGHLEDARVITQMRGGNPDSWAEVRENLPLLADESWYVRVKNGYARGWEAQYTVDRAQQFAKVLEWRSTARHEPGAGRIDDLAGLEDEDLAQDESGLAAPLSAAAEPATATAP
ncbi:MAG: membrane-bound lytic murein transglycosylase MltF [Steroidobacteraceae bacterium]|nr:membrane-bound lytic murein transglycosylase MltF [Nevskiaceae bacterium]MCP5466418.1 membrane-bound lytic murein transglycosylase MltF [Nevskiaceae bacterium]MCP5471881.1 membrane-bound lytic murein transglycosylase MltF [Nevskiaceae bacterium]